MCKKRPLLTILVGMLVVATTWAQQPGFQILFGPTLGVAFAYDQKFNDNIQAVRTNNNVKFSPLMTSIGLDLQERIFLRNNFQFVFRQSLIIYGTEQGIGLPYYQNTLGLQLPNGLEFGVGPRFAMAEIQSVAGTGRNNQYLSNTTVFYLTIPLNFGDFVVPLGLASTLGVPATDVPYTALYEANIGFGVPLLDIRAGSSGSAAE